MLPDGLSPTETEKARECAAALRVGRRKGSKGGAASEVSVVSVASRGAQGDDELSEGEVPPPAAGKYGGSPGVCGLGLLGLVSSPAQPTKPPPQRAA